MHEQQLRHWLAQVSSGDMDIDEAVRLLRDLPFQDLGFARVDHHRELRCGASEVILCEGKTPSQVAAIAVAILSKGDVLLATRADAGHYAAVKEQIPDACYRETARCIVWSRRPIRQRGDVLVMTAGTCDIPVASEAQVTAETLGAQVTMISDVGVAGLHRLLHYGDHIRRANAIVVVAGMEGALASVVGGLSSRPVIGVPTSIGYGASLGGLAPMLTMLNSCAAGVSVVNIDNGFGAGYIAATINAQVVQAREEAACRPEER